MATEPFWGTWKVTEVTPVTGHPEILLLDGIEFTLKENGDVVWKYSENFDQLPLFDCDTFEVLRERDGFTIVVLLRFGAWKGCIVEFLVDNEHSGAQNNFPRNMQLTLEGWCSMTCQSVRKLGDSKFDINFHFLPALDHGIFHDFTIESRSNRAYNVHKTILNTVKINTDEKFLTSSFFGFSDEVTLTLLHFIYSRCLPPNLTRQTAHEVIEFARNQPNFNRLGKLCENFIKNTTFQNELVALVQDMHDALNQTLLLYGGKTMDENGKELSPRNRAIGRSLITNPAKLCSVIKQTFANFLLVGLKIIQFCDKFVKFKPNLSKKDQISVFLYAKAQLPLFITKIRELCKALKAATADMDASIRYDIASYFVPEIEELMSSITNFGLGIQDAHQKVIEATCQTREYNLKSARKKEQNRSLKHILITKEILYMKTFDDRLGVILSYLIQEREGFVEQPAAEKVRDISRQIEQLVDEIPFTIHKLQSFSNILQEKLDLESFKFCFTVASSLITELLEKYKMQKRSLRHFVGQLVSQLQNESIEECLIQLGLYESPGAKPKSVPKQDVEKSPLNLTAEFSSPLMSTESNLSAFSYNLLQSLEGCDMEFKIKESDPFLAEGSCIEQEKVKCTSTTIKAHRIIVSSRCPWFRRALTSGMKESIERRIILHDCNLAVFKSFLQFLYAGLYKLDLSLEQPQFLADLLLLADRYEVDDLKSCCEEALILKVDNNSCFALLVLADQFQAGKLRRSCFEYIAQRPALSTEENLEELPDNLREEIKNLETWIREGLLVGADSNEVKKDETLRFSFKDRRDTRIDEEASLREIEDLTNNMRLTAQELEEERELERIPLTTDSSRLDSCVVSLREVLGPLVPEEILIQVALSADCNIDRALNHFFNNS